VPDPSSLPPRSDTGAFALVPEWLVYSGVSGTALKVYCVLARHADFESGECWPGRDRIAELLDCSPTSVDRAVTELVKARALKVRRRGLGMTNLYTVIRARVTTNGDSESPESATTDSPEVAREREPENQNQKNETSRPSPRTRRSSPEAKELTDEWWENLKAEGKQPRGSTAYVATRGIIQTILNEGVYSAAVIRDALGRMGTRPPTAQRLRDQCWGVNRETEEAQPQLPGWMTERYDETTGEMVPTEGRKADDDGQGGSSVASAGGIRGDGRDGRDHVQRCEPEDRGRARGAEDRGSDDGRLGRVPAGAEPAPAPESGGGGGAPRGDADDPVGDRGGGDRPAE
jgi:hypothetical protein